jgi:RecJ-like exonuclease
MAVKLACVGHKRKTTTCRCSWGVKALYLAAHREKFQPMPDKAHSDFLACPNCEGRGTVPSRLPFRRKPCHQCGGKGVVTPIRRQQLIAKVKAVKAGV